MVSLSELLKQQQEISAKIEQLRNDQRKDAIAKARELVAEYELTESDVFGKGKKATTSGSKVAPKYRDPATGATWTGRGKPPTWIANVPDRDAFLIKD